MRSLLICSLFILITLSVFSDTTEKNVRYLSATEEAALLKTLEKNLSKIKSFQTTFHQKKQITLFDETLEAEGQILFSFPQKIRFEIVKPFQSILIINGKKISKYEFNTPSWQKLKTKKSTALTLVMQQIAEWMQGKFSKESHVFKLHAEEAQNSLISIVLRPIPKPFAKVIKEIVILIAPKKDRFLSITIKEPDGDFTKLIFKTENRGVVFPPETFNTSRATPVKVERKKELP